MRDTKTDSNLHKKKGILEWEIFYFYPFQKKIIYEWIFDFVKIAPK